MWHCGGSSISSSSWELTLIEALRCFRELTSINVRHGSFVLLHSNFSRLLLFCSRRLASTVRLDQRHPGDPSMRCRDASASSSFDSWPIFESSEEWTQVSKPTARVLRTLAAAHAEDLDHRRSSGRSASMCEVMVKNGLNSPARQVAGCVFALPTT